LETVCTALTLEYIDQVAYGSRSFVPYGFRIESLPRLKLDLSECGHGFFEQRKYRGIMGE